MIDERRIDDKTIRGTEYTVCGFTLLILIKLYQDKWLIPYLTLISPQASKKQFKTKLSLNYEQLKAFSVVFSKAEKECKRLENWRLKENKRLK